MPSSRLLLICVLLVTASTAGAAYRQQDLRGWTVHISTDLGNDVHTALRILDQQLAFISDRVPADAVRRLREVPLWLSPEYPGTGAKAEYHPSRDWLLENGRNPAMAKAVEFTNIRIFEKELRRMPVFVLHELAHAYHDRVLGFGHPEVKAAYQRAVSSKSYEAVPRNDGRTNRSYAITDHKEYFAELTEAFFGTNDFYPFTQSQLKQHDPEMHALLGRLWANPKAPANASILDRTSSAPGPHPAPRRRFYIASNHLFAHSLPHAFPPSASRHMLHRLCRPCLSCR